MERLSITHGMPVVDAHGRALGVVEVSTSEHVLFRKGFLRRHFHAAALTDVANLEEGAVHLREGAVVLGPDQPDLTSGIKQGVLPFQRSLLDGEGAHG